MGPGIDGTSPEDVRQRPLSVLHVVRSTRRRGAEVFAHGLSAALEAAGLDSRVVALTGSDAGHPLPVPVLGARPLGVSTLRALRAAARGSGSPAGTGLGAGATGTGVAGGATGAGAGATGSGAAGGATGAGAEGGGHGAGAAGAATAGTGSGGEATGGVAGGGPVDVVVAHGSRTLDACALALAGTGIPFVYRSIGDPAAWSAHGLRRLRTALLLRRAARVAVLWPGAGETLRSAHGVPAGRIAVIPNGVPAAEHPAAAAADRAAARASLGLPASGFVAACIGALFPEKRVAAVITAVAGLPDAHLLVVGDGPDRPALAELASAAAPGRVVFAGVLPGPGEALAAADVVVLASRTEGMPGVLIEAGLAGRPCLATAVGGVPAVVEDGVTGVLVPPDDDEALDRALADLRAAAPDALAEMGAAAHARCTARFTMPVVTEAWSTLLRTTAARAATG